MMQGSSEQNQEADSEQRQVQPRTFCRTVRRVTYTGEVKQFSCVAEGIPSLNRATKSVEVDPKPGDLSMSRMKPL